MFNEIGGGHKKSNTLKYLEETFPRQKGEMKTRKPTGKKWFGLYQQKWGGLEATTQLHMETSFF